MTIKNMRVALLAVFACCFVSVVRSFADDVPGQEEYKRIDALAKEGDATKVEDYYQNTLSTWKTKNKEVYAALMLHLTEKASSGAFGKESQHSLARRYALRGLSSGESLSVRTELGLVSHLFTKVSSTTVNTSAFAVARREEIVARLRLMKHIADDIDPNWKPVLIIRDNSPMSLLIGTDASGKVNEELRDKKLAEVKLKEEKQALQMEINSEQDYLRKIKEKEIPRITKYIINAYSTPPYNTSELSEYMTNYNIDPGTRKEILDAVSVRIGSSK
mgnify:CR=1 FL=1